MIGLKSWIRADKLTLLSWTHELLKCKLYGYHTEMDSFLSFGQQHVVVNGVKSDWACFVRSTFGHRSWSIVVVLVY